VRRGAELVATPQIGKRLLLDPRGQLQCTSCHDPHDNENGNFLLSPNRRSSLCTSCHAPSGWETSDHARSQSTWNRSGADPWPGSKFTTVADNACGSCHASHGAKLKQRLIRGATLTDSCLVCHNGNVAAKNLGGDLAKWSAHPVGKGSTAHDPTERIDGRATHVECVDCHSPHRAAAGPGVGDLPAALAGASGLSVRGSPLEHATAEHEVCFKCHADDLSSNTRRVPRVIAQPNHRLQFQPENPSFHPVGAVGKGVDVPSLIGGLSPTSTIRCTSCHASDSGPGAGGTGPSGPHGSRWDYLLERQYVVADNVAESPQTYALCYKCHDRLVVLSSQSFSRHATHVVNDKASCSVCHDPHGVSSAAGGSPTQNGALINFDTRSVTPNAKGVRSFTSLGPGHGQCSLSCHGKDHDRAAY
jgi:predicted CXXCH cytochrome family protein